jgi:hypothetical protein
LNGRKGGESEGRRVGLDSFWPFGPGRRNVDLAGPPSNDLPAGAGTR